MYIYLSNESDEPVYFDNFQVTHERGKIIEENHYYSYGLKIEGISSRAQETVLNKYGYQGDFSEHDEETALDEFDLRHYDPQTGRWTTTDPYEQFASPYLGMGNSPVGNVDPDGGWIGDSFIQDFAIKHFLPAMVGAAIGAIATNGDVSDKLRGAALGFGIGMGASYAATEVNWGAVGSTLGNIGDFAFRENIDNIPNILTMEDVVSKLMAMKIGQDKTGAEVKDMSKKFGDLPISITKILKTVEKTNNGLIINFTWLGRTILNTVPGTPDIKNGAFLKINRVTWPNDSYKVWHISSSDITNVKYKSGGKLRKGNLNIYLHNNAYTDKIAPGSPNVWQIFKGNWYTP